MTQLQLVTLYILLNEYTDFDFKRVVKLSDSLKIAIGRLMWFRDINFFSWMLLKKMQDKSLKQFKVIKLSPGMLFPVQVSDKTAKVQVEKDDNASGYSPMGQ